MCSHTVNFSTEPGCVGGICAQLTLWWLKGVQTITSIISILKINTHAHTHAFTYIYSETCANSDTMARVRVGRRRTLMHAEELGKKLFIFRPLFASFLLALGLSACLCVTKRNEGVNRNLKKKRPSLFLLLQSKLAIFPLLFFGTRWQFSGHKGWLHSGGGVLERAG